MVGLLGRAFSARLTLRYRDCLVAKLDSAFGVDGRGSAHETEVEVDCGVDDDTTGGVGDEEEEEGEETSSNFFAVPQAQVSFVYEILSPLELRPSFVLRVKLD